MLDLLACWFNVMAAVYIFQQPINFMSVMLHCEFLFLLSFY